MRYNRLGRSGLFVSVIGLGGNTFGRFCDVEQTKAIVDFALDNGVNHIDTAESYSGGMSEELIGLAIRGKRDRVILQTKTGTPTGTGPNERGLSRRRIIAALEGSLTRLGTDYVDIYYLHYPDSNTPVEETLRAIDDLISGGKIRYFGICNHDAWRVAEVVLTADVRACPRPVVVQSHYNMLVRSLENEVLPACDRFGLGFVAHTPLAGGFLTGKYRRGESIPGGVRAAREARFSELWMRDEYHEALERYRAFAEARSHSVAELAVAWLLAQPLVSSVLIGATKVEQLQANLNAPSWALSAVELAELTGPRSAHRVRILNSDQGLVLANRD